MKMKPKILAFFSFACIVTVCASLLPTLRTEVNSFPKKGVVVKRTYRGEQCIIYELDKKNLKARSFIINGKVVAGESDEDGDGFFERFTIYDPETRDSEEFIRKRDGVVIPLDSESLEDLKSKKAKADKLLSEFLRTNAAPVK